MKVHFYGIFEKHGKWTPFRLQNYHYIFEINLYTHFKSSQNCKIAPLSRFMFRLISSILEEAGGCLIAQNTSNWPFYQYQ